VGSRSIVFGYIKARGTIYREAAPHDCYGREVRGHLEHGEGIYLQWIVKFYRIEANSTGAFYTYIQTSKFRRPIPHYDSFLYSSHWIPRIRLFDPCL